MKTLDEMKKLEREREKLIETLLFYADPGSYFAIALFPDPPCGQFIEDYSETELGEKPGKLARETLTELYGVVWT